LFFIQLTRNLW